MKTTIQISERTLQLLKRLKEEMKTASYDETINKVAALKSEKSMGGSLKKYMKKGESLKDILKDLRDEDDRY